MSYLSETIPEALDGQRVDRVVAMLCDCTRSAAATALLEHLVTLDGHAAAKASTKVHAGQRLEVLQDPTAIAAPLEPCENVAVDVIYEDDDIIVVNKAPGVVVHPGAGTTEPTLVEGLLARYGDLAGVGEAHRPGIVHRLDKGTSGLMVVARTAQAYESLVSQLSVHDVHRRYEAVVWGHVESPAGMIDAPIGRSRRNPLQMTIQLHGKFARTRYHTIEHFDDPAKLSLVELELETGRTHQIRVHLASIGHPVVGDEVYGPKRSSVKVSRPMLQARQLGFEHPGTGEYVEFEVGLEAEFAALLEQLRAAKLASQVAAPEESSGQD